MMRRKAVGLELSLSRPSFVYFPWDLTAPHPSHPSPEDPSLA